MLVIFSPETRQEFEEAERYTSARWQLAAMRGVNPASIFRVG